MQKNNDEQNIDILHEDRANIADLFGLRPQYDAHGTASQPSPLWELLALQPSVLPFAQLRP